MPFLRTLFYSLFIIFFSCASKSGKDNALTLKPAVAQSTPKGRFLQYSQADTRSGRFPASPISEDEQIERLVRSLKIQAMGIKTLNNVEDKKKSFLNYVKKHQSEYLSSVADEKKKGSKKKVSKRKWRKHKKILSAFKIYEKKATKISSRNTPRNHTRLNQVVDDFVAYLALKTKWVEWFLKGDQSINPHQLLSGFESYFQVKQFEVVNMNRSRRIQEIDKNMAHLDGKNIKKKYEAIRELGQLLRDFSDFRLYISKNKKSLGEAAKKVPTDLESWGLKRVATKFKELEKGSLRRSVRGYISKVLHGLVLAGIPKDSF